MLAYSKITLYAALLDSDLPEDPALDGELERYFPLAAAGALRRRMQRHRLRREIIATRVTNDLSTARARRSSSACARTPARSPADIARASVVARDVFDMRALWTDIEALDGPVPADVQSEMLLSSRRWSSGRRAGCCARGRGRWTSRPRSSATAAAAEAVADALPEILVESELQTWRERVARLTEAGVPEPVAARVARQGALFSALDIVEVAARDRARGRGGRRAALRDRREPAACTGCATRSRCCRATNRWQAMARAALRDDLFSLHAELTTAVLRFGGRDAWVEANRPAVDRAQEILGEIRSGGTFDLTTLPVALREVRNLIGPRVGLTACSSVRNTRSAIGRPMARKVMTGRARRALLLTTTGRKSGEARELPLIYGVKGDDYLIVASKGGSRRAAGLVPEPQGQPRGRGAGQGRPLQGARA